MRVTLLVVTIAIALFATLFGSPWPVALANSTATPTTAATPEPTLDPMAAGGVAMIRTATAMELGAAALDIEAARAGDTELAALADHWRADAQMLRAQGIQMLVSRTAGDMVHDPDQARELNLESLRANGEIMIAMGEAMVTHGEEMTVEVAALRDAGHLTPELADQLQAAAAEMVSTGERVRDDGEEMRNDAETLLHSIGK